MGARRKFSAEYKREAVAMVEVPGVTVHQVATELGIGAGMLGRWRRELRQETPRTFPGHGRPREEEVVQLKRELVRVTKERDFLREAAAFFARASR
jgi:transposase